MSEKFTIEQAAAVWAAYLDADTGSNDGDVLHALNKVLGGTSDTRLDAIEKRLDALEHPVAGAKQSL